MGADNEYIDETKKDGVFLDAAEMKARAGRGSTEGTVLAVTAEELGVDEKKLVRKLDLHLIPFVMLAYLLSFLDR